MTGHRKRTRVNTRRIAEILWQRSGEYSHAMAHFSFPMGNGLELELDGTVLARACFELPSAPKGCSSCSGCLDGESSCASERRCTVVETQEVFAVRAGERYPHPAAFAVIEEPLGGAEGTAGVRAFQDHAQLTQWLERMARNVPRLAVELKAQMTARS